MSPLKVLDTKAGMIIAIGAVGFVALYLVKGEVEDGLNAISPTNPDNIFAQGVDSVGAIFSGDENWSLGGWLYDVGNGTPEEQAARRNEAAFIKSIGG